MRASCITSPFTRVTMRRSLGPLGRNSLGTITGPNGAARSMLLPSNQLAPGNIVTSRSRSLPRSLTSCMML